MALATKALLVTGVGLALVYLVKTSNDESPVPATSDDCYRDASELMARNIDRIGSTRIRAIASNLRSRGADEAAECLELMAEGKTADCRALLIDPLSQMLRTMNADALEFTATQLRLLGTGTARGVADCLQREAQFLKENLA